MSKIEHEIPKGMVARIEGNKIIIEPKESKDENIKIKLIEFFKGYSPDEEWWGNISKENILTWLEKQGEQNLSWSEEDERIRQDIENLIHFALKDGSAVSPGADTTKEDALKLLKSLKERYAWKPSDEQIETLEHFVRSLGESGYMSPYDHSTKILYSLLHDLK